MNSILVVEIGAWLHKIFGCKFELKMAYVDIHVGCHHYVKITYIWARKVKFDWKIEIGLYLAHSHYKSACLSNGQNIGLFQFSSQISVTLVSVLFTPALVNPIYQLLSC